MVNLTYDASSGAYFALGVEEQHAPLLADLRWQAHPGRPRAWWTRSPYLAAPLWSWVGQDDQATRTALGPFAWSYRASFAAEPLRGVGVDAVRLPAGERPYPFQVAGIQLAALRRRVLIADEPGCGKSMQALGVANLLRSKRIVIGCPAFLADNWAAECEKWLCDPQSITVMGRGRRGPPDEGVVILPYSRGHRYAAAIAAGPPVDLLVMDEPDQLKTSAAKRTAPWLGEGRLCASARRVVAIGGSPIPNHPLEVHGLLRALSPETMGSVGREAFKALYCSTFKGTAKVQRKGGGEATVQFEKNSGRHEAALNAELRASGVMVRRMKADVLPQLPPKHVFLVHLAPTAAIEDLVREEATLYDLLETRLLTARELVSLQGHVANVRARLGLLKAPKIAEYVRHVFDQGETRVVLFMMHLAAIEVVRAAFDPTRIRVRVMTGSESFDERHAHVKEFQRPGGAELIVGQVTASGVGLTMTAARYAVLGEISWVPTVNDQAIDRVHRITQTRQVEAPVVTFPHAVEERVLRSNAGKLISAKKVLDVNLQYLVECSQ